MVLYHSNLPRSEWNLGTRTHDDCSCDQQHEKHSDFHQHPQTKHHKLVGLIQVGFESQDPDRMGNKYHGECGHIEEQPTTKQLDVSQACTHGNTTTFQMYPWWCWNCVTFFKSLQKCWCDTSSLVIFFNEYMSTQQPNVSRWGIQFEDVVIENLISMLFNVTYDITCKHEVPTMWFLK